MKVFRLLPMLAGQVFGDLSNPPLLTYSTYLGGARGSRLREGSLLIPPGSCTSPVWRCHRTFRTPVRRVPLAAAFSPSSIRWAPESSGRSA